MGEPGALAPGLREQRDQIPLRAARVLKLVDEDVVVARLEAIAALGELLHLAEQRARVQQEIREIEDGVGVERPPVLGLGHFEHAPHAARDEHVEVAAIRGVRIHDRRRVREDEITVHLPVGRRREIVLRCRAASSCAVGRPA